MNKKRIRKVISAGVLSAVLCAGTVYTGGCGRHETDTVSQNGQSEAASAEDFAENQKQAEVSGEQYRAPDLEEYTQAAVDHMLQVSNHGIEDSGQPVKDVFPELEDDASVGERQSWQMLVRDPDVKWQTCQDLLDYYLRSYRQPDFLESVPADTRDYYCSVEQIGYEKIAGDDRDFVAVVSFRQILFEDEIQALGDKTDSWGTLYQPADSGEFYLYGRAALHIRMPEDYICELADIADADTVLAAFAQAEPENASAYENALVSVLPKEAAAGRFHVFDGTLQVTFDGGTSWTDVPLSTELLFERGDERDGALTQVQEGSYTVSEDLAAIAYGGSPSMPLSVIVSTDQGKNWKKVTVPAQTSSVRRLFLCRAGDSDTLYLVATSDRTMSTEGEYLYVSHDKGSTWSQVDSHYKGNSYHFLDTDASFTDENTGFLCMQDSQKPSMFYTTDGGRNWLEAQFEELPARYTMAYAPEICGEGLQLYVGQDGYAKESGSVYRMVSTDGGASWKKDREYYFQ